MLRQMIGPVAIVGLTAIAYAIAVLLTARSIKRQQRQQEEDAIEWARDAARRREMHRTSRARLRRYQMGGKPAA